MRKVMTVLLLLFAIIGSIFAGEKDRGYIGVSGGYQLEDNEIIHSTYTKKFDVNSYTLNIDGAYLKKNGKDGYLFTASIFFPQSLRWDTGDVTDDYDYLSIGAEVLKAHRFKPSDKFSFDMGLGIGYELLKADMEKYDSSDIYFHFFSFAGQAAINYSLTDHFTFRVGLDMTIPVFTYYAYYYYWGTGEHRYHRDDTFDFMAGVTAQPFIGAAYTF